MKYLHIILFVLVALFNIACAENEDPKPVIKSDIQEITSVTENGLTVTLLASKGFFVGYNVITARIEDANGDLLSGNVLITPMMEMSTMSHSCPIEFPEGGKFENGSYTFNIVFVMPTGDMGSWHLNFIINDTEVKIPVEVQAPELPRLVSFVSMSTDSSKYYVALVNPVDPQVGQNNLELVVYKKKSKMDWPAVSGMQFEMEPWMVSMDHGSPNNVAPVHTENGHYEGIVNFTMTGDWQIRLTMKDKNQVCGKPYFDLYFQ